MRKSVVGAAAVALSAVGMLLLATSAGAAAGQAAGEQQFVVVYAAGASTDAAHAAIAAAGGTVIKENTAVGVATVATTNAGFAANATAAKAIEGVAHNQAIGKAPEQRGVDVKKFDPAQADVEAGIAPIAAARGSRPARRRRGGAARRPAVGHAADRRHRRRLLQVRAGQRACWSASSTRASTAPPGHRARTSTRAEPQLHRRTSRSTRTAPRSTDRASDPTAASTPPTSTTTATARTWRPTIASPINGIGIAGVAPKATIVNLRAGQDSGYFFLQPSVDALTYAGDARHRRREHELLRRSVAVQLRSNPADSPADQAEQRTIIKAMQRALDYAHRHGVTLVSAAGNGATDYTKVDHRRVQP